MRLATFSMALYDNSNLLGQCTATITTAIIMLPSVLVPETLACTPLHLNMSCHIGYIRV